MKREANIQWVDKKGNRILLMVADRLRRKIYVTEETFIELFKRNSETVKLLGEYSKKYPKYKVEVNDEKILKINSKRITISTI